MGLGAEEGVNAVDISKCFCKQAVQKMIDSFFLLYFGHRSRLDV